MINLVIDGLLADLQPLSGIFTRMGGVIRVQKDKSTQGGQERRYPVISMPAGDCNQGDYLSMAPSSSEGGILYFQAIGRPVTEEVLAGVYRQDSVLRVVGWFNSMKVSNAGANLAMNVVAALNKRQPSIGGYITNITVKFLGMEEKTNAIFSEFTYSEAEAQYLMKPYDFFSFTIEVGYLVTPSCAPSSTAIENECA